MLTLLESLLFPGGASNCEVTDKVYVVELGVSCREV